MNLHFSLNKNAHIIHNIMISYTYNDKLHKGSVETMEKIRDKSPENIIIAYKDVGIIPSDGGILEIAVPFDGAWHRRGHSSHVGLPVVIDVLTKLPIDYEVLCNFFVRCKNTISEKDEFNMKHTANCQKNYDGSANSMEVECALRLWRRLTVIMGKMSSLIKKIV